MCATCTADKGPKRQHIWYLKTPGEGEEKGKKGREGGRKGKEKLVKDKNRQFKNLYMEMKIF